MDTGYKHEYEQIFFHIVCRDESELIFVISIPILEKKKIEKRIEYIKRKRRVVLVGSSTKTPSAYTITYTHSHCHSQTIQNVY